MRQLLNCPEPRGMKPFRQSVKSYPVRFIAAMGLAFLCAAGQPAWAQTWTVDSVSDTAGSATPGQHTLRWAIGQAANGDRIEFQSGLDGQTIFLKSPLVTGKSLEFGGGAGTVRLSGSPEISGSLLQSSSDTVWNFDKIIIQNAQGAGVETGGSIRTFAGTVTNNHGGGIRAGAIGDFSGTATHNTLNTGETGWYGVSAYGGGVRAASITNLSKGKITDNMVNLTNANGGATATGGGMDVSLISKVTGDILYERNTAHASGSGYAKAEGGGMRVDVMDGTDSGRFIFNDNKAEAFVDNKRTIDWDMTGYATASGGGLSWQNAGNINAQFTGNSAIAKAEGSNLAVASGGGMFGNGVYGFEGEVNGVFDANIASATSYAGSAFATGGGLDSYTLTSIDGLYTGNKAEAHSERGWADAHGGGANFPGLKESSASFYGNTAQATTTDGMRANAAGGALWCEGGLTILGGSYQNNQAIASGNGATAKGGALYLYLRSNSYPKTLDLTLDASSANILFKNNNVSVNGKTTKNDIYFGSDASLSSNNTDFTITGNNGRSVSLYSGIHAEDTGTHQYDSSSTFHMIKKGDATFNWGGVNVFERKAGNTVSFAEGTSNIMSDFTADAVPGNLALNLGTSHALNLNLTGRDNDQAFFSGLASLTLEEGTRLTVSLDRAEPNTPWVNLGKWLFAEGTGWDAAQLNTMGFMTSLNGIWYSGGVFLSDAKGLWLNLEHLGKTSATPIPGAVWLLGSGLAGVAALRRRMQAA